LIVSDSDVIITMSLEMTSLPSARPMPVVPAASDPHGPVIVKYAVLAFYLFTFVMGLVGNTPRPLTFDLA